MTYKIYGNTIFIESNGVIGHYLVHGDNVKKVVTDKWGDDTIQDFHTLGELPLNSESKLLNELRDRGEV